MSEAVDATADQDLPRLHVGDHVRDRQEPDGKVLVTGLTAKTAADYEIEDGLTVADANPEYPADDKVIEIGYAQRCDLDVPKQNYAFPRSRLELVTPLHDRGEDDG